MPAPRPGAPTAMTGRPPALDEATLRRLLPECLAVPRFVAEVAAGAPYATVDELIDTASDAAAEFDTAELDQALAHHPRIGERAAGDGTAAAFSRREQTAPDADDADLATAIAQGNREYEARFGRVFLIRAAGRSRADILAELRRRLLLDDAEERRIVAAELRDIAMLRIRSLYEGAPVSPGDPTPTSR